jgi:hypothetical protein
MHIYKYIGIFTTVTANFVTGVITGTILEAEREEFDRFSKAIIDEQEEVVEKVILRLLFPEHYD